MNEFFKMFNPQNMANMQQTAVQLSQILRDIYVEIRELNANLRAYNESRPKN